MNQKKNEKWTNESSKHQQKHQHDLPQPQTKSFQLTISFYHYCHYLPSTKEITKYPSDWKPLVLKLNNVVYRMKQRTFYSHCWNSWSYINYCVLLDLSVYGSYKRQTRHLYWLFTYQDAICNDYLLIPQSLYVSFHLSSTELAHVLLLTYLPLAPRLYFLFTYQNGKNLLWIIN